MRLHRSQVTWAVLYTRGCGSWDFFLSKRRRVNKNILESPLLCHSTADFRYHSGSFLAYRVASLPAGASHGIYTSAISLALNWRAKEEIVCADCLLVWGPSTKRWLWPHSWSCPNWFSILLYLVALLNEVMERWQSVGDFGVPQMTAFLTVVFTYCCFTEKKSFCSSIAGNRCKKTGPWDVR